MAAKRRSWDALSPAYRGRLERALRRLGHENPRQYYESGANLQRARGHQERREHVIRKAGGARKVGGGGGPRGGASPAAQEAIANFLDSAPERQLRHWRPLIREAKGDDLEQLGEWLYRLREMALDWLAGADVSGYVPLVGEVAERYPDLASRPEAFWYHWG